MQGGQLQTGYITLNVTQPPFDKLEVRKAVNMAINKERITQIINGRAVPATQPLPPSMPGYTEGYAGYAYDPEGAKALLAEAGLARAQQFSWDAAAADAPRLSVLRAASSTSRLYGPCRISRRSSSR